MVRFNGTVQGPQSQMIGITFALYRDQQGGAPLWIETQTVSLDASGHYNVQLGSTSPNGLPKDVFASAEARWLGVQPEGQAEQPRILLLSVPYALKAADAETVGGLPPSAFVLATPPASATGPAASAATSGTAASLAPPPGTVSGTGTANFLPLWTDNADIGNSVVFQSGTGSTAKIGINTTTPTTTLDVKGTGTVRGLFTLPSVGVATAAKGSNSQALNMTASSFSSSTNAAVNQSFRWQAESAGNNTATPSGTLNLLFGSGTTAPVETGLKVASNGLMTFANGQSFPGTGTISGVTVGPGLIGGGSSGNVTVALTGSCGLGQVLQWTSVTWGCGTVLTSVTAGTDLTTTTSNGNVTVNLDTTHVPQLNVANTFNGNQTVSGNLSATGAVTGSSFQIGNALFAFGTLANFNSFLGFSGNTTMTGSSNAASGYAALSLNTSGSFNTATGQGALSANTTGGGNTASGSAALESNSTGSNNTASGNGALISSTSGSNNTANGMGALIANTSGGNNTGDGYWTLFYNTTGSNNTGLGYLAGPDQAHVNLTNATAIGAFSQVTASNSLVLGSINGVNGATADTNVGIGTTAPAAKLDVHGNANFTGPITFASGQSFPGTGTITGVTAGAGLTGGGTTGGITLNLDTTKVPLLNVANSFIGNQSISGNITATGNITANGSINGSTAVLTSTSGTPALSASNSGGGYAGSFQGDIVVTGPIWGEATVSGLSVNATNGFTLENANFGLGDPTHENAYLGFAGNGSSVFTTYSNTAVGSAALASNAGSSNTAIGVSALHANNSGTDNTALGTFALGDSVGGSYNTAVGFAALETDGNYNTAVGYVAGTPNSNLSNATAIGAFSYVTANNSLVLGSINGVNGATASTNIGIGTTAPASTLDVEATAPALVGPIFLLKNNAPIQSGTFGNSVDLHFALDGGSSVGNPNAYIRAAEDGNSQYGAFMSFATMADGGAGSGPLERMRIAANGFVGVGVTAPTHIFQVGQGLGNAFADGWSTYSSRRWKTNIQTLPNALAKVEQLRGVSYDLKGSGKHEIGVIAEEVGEVVPEVVSFEENGKDAQGVDYSRLTALLIEGMKQQQRQIQEQSEQIAKLNRKVGLLETALRTGGHAEESTAVARSMKGTHNSSSNPGNVTSQPGN